MIKSLQFVTKILLKYCANPLTKQLIVVLLLHNKNKQKEIFVNNNNEVSPDQLLTMYIHHSS